MNMTRHKHLPILLGRPSHLKGVCLLLGFHLTHTSDMLVDIKAAVPDTRVIRWWTRVSYQRLSLLDNQTVGLTKTDLSEVRLQASVYHFVMTVLGI